MAHTSKLARATRGSDRVHDAREGQPQSIGACLSVHEGRQGGVAGCSPPWSLRVLVVTHCVRAGSHRATHSYESPDGDAETEGVYVDAATDVGKGPGYG